MTSPHRSTGPPAMSGARISWQLQGFDPKGTRLLTEHQINQSWRRLFSGGHIDEKTFEKAESLLDGLRPESPLRHRLGAELEELRKLKLQEQR
jgi:hypothetical protein